MEIKKIAITGPESSGKTTLAKMLAAHFETVWVPEFARFYLSNLHRPYIESDLLAIAKGQIALEQQKQSLAKEYLFSDTEMTVIKIWSEVKYKRCPAEIFALWEQQDYDLYILCTPDFVWEYDPLRENPDDRTLLFDLYQKALKVKKTNYIIVTGSPENRLQQTITQLLS